MKKFFCLAALLCQCISSFAAIYEYGQTVVISKPVFENIYVAGGNIIINAPVHGDLVVAGGTIVINDTVTNDILLAGGTVTFKGFVGGDIRCTGGKLDVFSRVSGDIVIAAGKIFIRGNAVTGNIMATGGSVFVDGMIKGDLTGMFGELILNGNVSGNLNVRGNRITVNGDVEGRSVLAARTLMINPGASFSGDVRYWSKNGKQDFAQSVSNGKAIFDPTLAIRSGEWYFLGAASVAGLLLFLGMVMVMILIVQYLFSSTMKKAASIALDHSLRSLGAGALFLIGAPVVMVVLFITVIGIPVGLLILATYLLILLLAIVINSVLIANWLNNVNQRNWGYWKICFVSLSIYIVIKLFSLMPFVGWFVMLFVVCMGLGSIVLSVMWKMKKRRLVPVADK